MRHFILIQQTTILLKFNFFQITNRKQNILLPHLVTSLLNWPWIPIIRICSHNNYTNRVFLYKWDYYFYFLCILTKIIFFLFCLLQFPGMETSSLVNLFFTFFVAEEENNCNWIRKGLVWRKRVRTGLVLLSPYTERANERMLCKSKSKNKYQIFVQSELRNVYVCE